MSTGRAISKACGTAVLTLALGGAAVPAVAQELEVVPGVRLGALMRDGGEADLIAAYGTQVVRPVDVDLGEGERAPGTLLFPDDERRRVEIVLSWQGGRLAAALGEAVPVFFTAGESAQQRPEFLEVQGDRPFASDLAALRALAPTVGRIVVGFEPP